MDSLFKIYKVDKNEALRINNAINNPHKHDFEELIICVKGKIDHFIDFKTVTLNSPFISFVTRGKIHKIHPQLVKGDCEIWVIRFKSEFIPETTFQLYNYYHDQAHIKIISHKRLNQLIQLCGIIQDEMLLAKPDLAIIKDTLAVIFSIINNEREKSNNPIIDSSNHTQNTTFQHFLEILEENFRQPQGVQYYAEKLFMTPKALNAITQNILHQTVTELIETRKLIEAKNLLFTTDKTISEIGFEIGYSDKAYFTSVFKKKSGQTPTEFRNYMKNTYG